MRAVANMVAVGVVALVSGCNSTPLEIPGAADNPEFSSARSINCSRQESGCSSSYDFAQESLQTSFDDGQHGVIVNSIAMNEKSTLDGSSSQAFVYDAHETCWLSGTVDFEWPTFEAAKQHPESGAYNAWTLYEHLHCDRQDSKFFGFTSLAIVSGSNSPHGN
jgi:hypothetical protein